MSVKIPTLWRKFLNNPGKSILALIGILLLAYTLTVIHSCRVLSHNAPRFPLGRTGTGHLVNVLGLIGLAVTSLGLWYAYIQLRIAEDRIDGYQKLYEWIFTLIDEIKSDKAAVLHFYGSTILPGNVSYSSTKDLSRYKSDLKKIFDRDPEFEALTNVCFIVPDEDGYENTYTWFHNKRVANHHHRLPDAAWVSFVEDKKRDALRLQMTLADGRESYTISTLRESDERFGLLKRAYFFSNGRRVIYAIPLHYVEVPDEGRHQEVTPELVGFTTNAVSIVKAFERHFTDVSPASDAETQLQLLSEMYSRHLLSPQAVERVLAARRVPLDGAPLSPAVLYSLDQDHFGGWQATERAVRILGIDESSVVLDVGSGFGGPARYISHRCKCHVHGIELQGDRHELAERLTKLTGLSRRVDLRCGDAVDLVCRYKAQYTHVIAQLSILHMHRKQQLLESMGAVLKRQGKMYIADYVRTRQLTPAETERLRQVVACPSLLRLSDYLAAIERGGIVVDNVVDFTGEWQSIATERTQKYIREKDEIVSMHGEDVYEKALGFSQDVDELFGDGIICGYIVVGHKG